MKLQKKKTSGTNNGPRGFRGASIAPRPLTVVRTITVRGGFSGGISIVLPPPLPWFEQYRDCVYILPCTALIVGEDMCTSIA